MSARVTQCIVDQASILAGQIDRYKIVEHIDRLALVADDERTHISIGIRVKALLLTGLRYPERTLYRAHQFFESLPIERLFGREGLLSSTLHLDSTSLKHYG